MKFKHVRDRERGYQRRIEDMEEALRHILLACDALGQEPRNAKEAQYNEALEIIKNKCNSALDKQEK